MYTLIRSISADVSEIKRFECSNTLWIVKFIAEQKTIYCVRVNDDVKAYSLQ